MFYENCNFQNVKLPPQEKKKREKNPLKQRKNKIKINI